MIEKYKKIPVEIEAVKYDGDNVKEILDFCHGDARMEEDSLIIQTLEDNKKKETRHEASIGDYIIKGVVGEFYPCKPDIFKKTYEKVNEEEEDIEESSQIVIKANRYLFEEDEVKSYKTLAQVILDDIYKKLRELQVYSLRYTDDRFDDQEMIESHPKVEDLTSGVYYYKCEDIIDYIDDLRIKI